MALLVVFKACILYEEEEVVDGRSYAEQFFRIVSRWENIFQRLSSVNHSRRTSFF